jgi:hypothetical protein
MRRHIVRRFDETNLCWIVDYVRVFKYTVHAQQFSTGCLSGRDKYVGTKTRHSETQIGLGALDQLSRLAKRKRSSRITLLS